LIDHEEVVEQNKETLMKYLQEVQSLEMKLAEARKQESDWRRIGTQHENELGSVKKKAMDLSVKLFGEKKSVGYPVDR
jgi:hypothetical protein